MLTQATVYRVSGPKARHGYSYAQEYRAWQTMRLRCTVPTNPAWASYGGRGIKVCDRWLESVEAFIEDMGPKPSPKHELDRYPNNDGNYEPGNCRWATRSENDRKRRSNRLVEHAGQTLTLAAWAQITGIRADTIGERLTAGWSPERALTTPARPKAAKGQGFKEIGNPCVECGGKTNGLRCRPCENRGRTRGADGTFLGKQILEAA